MSIESLKLIAAAESLAGHRCFGRRVRDDAGHRHQECGQRVSGISISREFGEGERVSIRGTAPNLNRTLLNRHAIATADCFVLDQSGRCIVALKSTRLSATASTRSTSSSGSSSMDNDAGRMVGIRPDVWRHRPPSSFDFVSSCSREWVLARSSAHTRSGRGQVRERGTATPSQVT
jgi:hypothetical protein